MSKDKCLCETDKIVDQCERLGRAHYICPECKRDVTMRVLLLFEAMEESKKLNAEKAKGK